MTMLSVEEIERLRDNLDCHSDYCEWLERADGSAWCCRCGSGFYPEARERIAKVWARFLRKNNAPPNCDEPLVP